MTLVVPACSKPLFGNEQPSCRTQNHSYPRGQYCREAQRYLPTPSGAPSDSTHRAPLTSHAVLPKHVSELLQNGSAVEDVLQEYPQITILFCYITGFKELTTSCDPYDVVDFVNSLFSDFDKVRPPGDPAAPVTCIRGLSLFLPAVAAGISFLLMVERWLRRPCVQLFRRSDVRLRCTFRIPRGRPPTGSFSCPYGKAAPTVKGSVEMRETWRGQSFFFFSMVSYVSLVVV